jgi:hypothetical protein
MYDASTDGIINNRKAIREFLYFLEDTPIHNIHEEIIPFQEGEYFKNKATQTKENYTVDIKKFCRYVYLREGVSVPDNLLPHNHIKNTKPRKKTKENITTEYKVPMAEPVVSEEYYEFLKRYEELNKE